MSLLLLLNDEGGGPPPTPSEPATYKNIHWPGAIQAKKLVRPRSLFSLELDGSGAFVSLPTIPLPSSTVFTHAAWVYQTNQTGYRPIFANSGPWGWYLKAGQLNWYAGGDNLGIATIAANTWTHVAVVVDGTNANFYINGVLDKQFARGSISYSSSPVVNIGTDGSNHFAGRLDDIAIWNYALDEKTIKRLALGLIDPNKIRGGLVSLFRAEEEVGTLVRDSSNNHFHGTITGGVTRSTDVSHILKLDNKLSSACLSFDGTNDYVACDGTTGLPDIGGAMSLSCWCKYNADTLTSGGYLLALVKDNTNSGNNGVGVYFSNRFAIANVGIFNWGGTRICEAYLDPTNGNWPADTWGHFCYTCEAGGANGRIYYNGRNITTPGSVITHLQTGSPQAVSLGRFNAAYPTPYFNQPIDDVAIFNGVLSEKQIRGLAAGTLDPAELSPTLLWRLDENTGTVAYDYSGYGNHGTVNGATWSTTVPTQLQRDYIQGGGYPGAIAEEIELPTGGLYDGLVAYYKMDGLSTEDEPDWYGKATAWKNGTVNAATGKIEGCRSFNGGSHLNIGTTPKFGFTNTMSISFWYNPWDGGNGAIISKWHQANLLDNCYTVVQGHDIDNGKLYFSVWQSDNSLVTVYGTSTPSAQNWHHVVVTADGTNLKIYIDNVLEGTEPYNGTLKNVPLRSLLLGRLRSEDTIYFYNGSLDEIAFFDYGLDEDQIDFLYNAGAGRPFEEFADYPPTSAETVGLSTIILWNVLQAIQKSNSLVWDTYSLVNKSASLVWDTLTSTGLMQSVVWDTKAVANKQAQTLWNTLSVAGNDYDAVWNTRALAGKDNQLLWDVFTSVGLSRDILWDVATLAGVASAQYQLKWNTNALVGADYDIPWHVRTSVNYDRSLLWNAMALVNQQYQTIWDTKAVTNKSVSALWDINQLANNQVSTLWNTLVSASNEYGTLWNVKALASKEQSLLWNVLNAVGVQNSVVWNLRALANKSADVKWGIFQLAGDEKTVVWDTRSVANQTKSLLWHDFTSVSKTNSLLWDAKALAGREASLLWDVLVPAGIVGNEYRLVWNTAGVATKTAALLWDTLVSAGYTRQLNWNISGVAGLSDSFLWNTRGVANRETNIQWQDFVNVGKTNILEWHTRQQAGVAKTVLWNLLSTAGATPQLLWHVNTKVGDAKSTIWNTNQLAGTENTSIWHVRALAGAAPVIRWDVRSTAGITKTMVWDTLQKAGVSKSMLWDTGGVAGRTDRIIWDTRGLASKETETIWSVLVPASSSLSIPWNINQLAGDERRIYWDLIGTAGKSTQVLWHTLAFSGEVIVFEFEAGVLRRVNVTGGVGNKVSLTGGV
jgi:hypothetical protein